MNQSAQRILTISNSGGDDIFISEILYPTGFSGSWSGVITAGSSKSVTVTFSPTEAQSYDGNVNVISDATSGEGKIACSGLGILPNDFPLITVSTVAGSGGQGPQNGGYADGMGTEARFNSPSGLAVDQNGNVYVADRLNYRIRKITTDGHVTTLAGTGKSGYSDGEGSAASFASFKGPSAMCMDYNGNIYVGDYFAGIRKVLANGDVFTIGPPVRSPDGIAIDLKGNIYISNASVNSLIYKVKENGESTIFAGSLNKQGYADGIGTEARFNSPSGLAVDQNGNVYVADMLNHRIRKITTDGHVTTLAGSGMAGYADGIGSDARFNHPVGVAVDMNGNVYVADSSNHRIRKITSDGDVTTLAGSGISGYADGYAPEARFNWPLQLALDSHGNIYFTDNYNRVRKITFSPKITISQPIPSARPDLPFLFSFGVTGTSSQATWSISQGSLPPGISFNTSNASLYGTPVSSGDFNFVVRVDSAGYSDEMPVKLQVFSRIINLSGNLSFGSVQVTNAEHSVFTISNTGSSELTVTGITYPIGFSGNWTGKIPPNSSQNVRVFFAPTSVNNFTGNITIHCDATSGISVLPCSGTGTPAPSINVSTVAGLGTPGHGDGQGVAAFFRQPTGVALDANGNVYVADTGNHLIRKITPTGNVTTLAGGGGNYWTGAGAGDGLGKAASFTQPSGVAVDSNGNVYVADTGNHLIRKITDTGKVTTLAGSETGGNVDGIGFAARFYRPTAIAVDERGNLYVADTKNNLIRKITPDGNVTTLARDRETSGFSDGMGENESFNNPHAIAVDKLGNVYVADTFNNRIRKITTDGHVTTLAGTGETGYADGIGSDARFTYPEGVAVDMNGNVYVADSGNNRIRKITASGYVTTLAGSGLYGFADGAGTSASFRVPTGLAVDNSGNIFVVDKENNRVRKITTSQ